MSLPCPNCEQPIPDSLIAKHFASKGGKAGSRSIDQAAQNMMQDARAVKRVVTRLEAKGCEYVQGPRGALSIKSTPEVSETIFPIAPLLESFRDPADGVIWYRLKRKPCLNCGEAHSRSSEYCGGGCADVWRYKKS